MAKYYIYTDSSVSDIQTHVRAALTEANITWAEEISDATYTKIKSGTNSMASFYPLSNNFYFSVTGGNTTQNSLSPGITYYIYVVADSIVIRNSSTFIAITKLTNGGTSYVTSIIANSTYTDIRSYDNTSSNKTMCSCSFAPSTNKVFVFPFACTSSPSPDYKSEKVFMLLGATLSNFTPYIINNETYIHLLKGIALKFV